MTAGSPHKGPVIRKAFPWHYIINHELVNPLWNESLIIVLVNTLRPIQNGRLLADDIFTCIFLNEKVWISIKISLTFVPKGPINNIPALVQIMAWRQPGDKPLSEPMMFSLLTHICATRPQWVNTLRPRRSGHHFLMTISNEFSWTKIYKFRLRSHWSLFPRVQSTIFQHSFR